MNKYLHTVASGWIFIQSVLQFFFWLINESLLSYLDRNLRCTQNATVVSVMNTLEIT